MTPNAKSILLAEDDPFISRMYQTKLSLAGYAVVLVGDGRSAFERIKTTMPDLAMLDLNMPELSGFDVIKGLIADGYEMQRTKMVVLTNSANPRDEATAKALGAAFMIKAEVTPQKVLDCIEQTLGGS